MKSILIRNATLVNEGRVFQSDVFISDGRIQKIGMGLTEKSSC